ncbi:kelch-like protein 1 [Gigantopelta aegis]|uniref:kelch-like protein 1 n=1 Tax=Gigantopelta aegis TaxID=1735272 RepID=UPI001B888EF2|nr:kelch-like protein 1 [Gigantopelta aegis]
MAGFVTQQVIVSSTSPGVSESSNSSYDDNPTVDGQGSDTGRIEQRLYIINRTGTGEVHYLLLTPDRTRMKSYKIHSTVWERLLNLTHFGVVVLKNNLYVLGGFDKSKAKHLRTVLKYDPVTGLWTEVCPMMLARAKFGVCATDDKIYVSGGEKGDGRVTARCEVYDVTTDTWSKAGMLVDGRANHAAVVYNNELMCAGGYNGDRSHNNIWVFEHHKWCQLDEDYPHHLPCSMDRFAVAILDNVLYFIGGVQSKVTYPSEKPSFTTRRKVFSFCTRVSAFLESTVKDLVTPWNFKLPPMIYARHSAGVVVLGKRIHVIGGQSLETGQSVNASEFFDSETGEWEEDFRFRKDVSNVFCAILEVPIIPVEERRDVYRLKWVLW